ncbi:hypothetical protein M427DRAFT_35813 [Gonapodya prolifera JEL478]|uniref:Uncharacterized protein n=1 Tax=Gonapodya prolifera (strain JEL478) TaxID=1344416 RepID=A0A139A3P1_GONPJ|nr:hypothetical protein M427DRAFT_35813 [Gonapodya prolifera JEL478]|eukprot:KXS11436.1 hypothetical protein M427DRAFT_35813 [Gonapodya prolifera JEL478]
MSGAEARVFLFQAAYWGWLEQLKARFITVEASLQGSMDEAMDIVAPGTFKRDPIPERSISKPRDVIDGVLENLEITVAAFREEVWKARGTLISHSPPTSVSASLSSPSQNIAFLQVPHFTEAEEIGTALPISNSLETVSRMSLGHGRDLWQ